MFNTRRDMLKLLGVAPFLAPAFRDVFAASETPIKRVVLMMTHLGVAAEHWFPTSDKIAAMDLSGTSLASLSGIKNKISIIQNITNQVGWDSGVDNHSSGGAAAFAANKLVNGGPLSNEGVSLDQHIVNKINFTNDLVKKRDTF